MEQIWDTENRQLALLVTINCTGTCRFRVSAEDLKPNSYYANRVIEVKGSRTIELKFPVTPKKIKVKVELKKHSTADGNFIVNIREKHLDTYAIHIDENTDNFLDFLIPFCQVAGFIGASPTGRVFKKGKFMIKYFTQIRDFASGRVINTPARIGHNTGIIENSEEKMIGYTIPQRIIIDLHEFSHKWKNPLMGLPIDNEIGADVNALYIGLGLGFSKVDIIYVFAKVFYGAQTDENIYRMRKIMDFITRFENQEFAKKLG